MSKGSQSPPSTNTVQPYSMHVSQRYLDLTKQKLELTRLPRDPRNAHRGWDFGVSKTDLEPLVDHWSGDYDWRTQERFYNDILPQFRVAINGTRLHFVHKRSHSPLAVPLLIIYGWPESFISCAKIIDALSNPVTTPPKGNDNVQSFHVVVPSIPGFAFSDQVPEAANNLQSTAEIFDTLMKGLGYRTYMIHGTGWGFKIARMLALAHPESCIAIHTVNPEIPDLRSSFDYTQEDMFSVASPMSGSIPTSMPDGSIQTHFLTPVSPPSTPDLQIIDRPQTCSYALCDSPAGLLAYMLDAIKPPPASTTFSAGGHSPGSLGFPSAVSTPVTPQSYSMSPPPARSPSSPATTHNSFELGDMSTAWTPTALLNWTMIYWLPGPEAALRWLHNSTPHLPLLWASYSAIPLGISDFRNYSPGVNPRQTPSQWAEAYHRIAMVRRREGIVRFPAWERPNDVVVDIRELAGMLGLGQQQQPMMLNVPTSSAGWEV